jgi:hypothetical protein
MRRGWAEIAFCFFFDVLVGVVGLYHWLRFPDGENFSQLEILDTTFICAWLGNLGALSFVSRGQTRRIFVNMARAMGFAGISLAITLPLNFFFLLPLDPKPEERNVWNLAFLMVQITIPLVVIGMVFLRLGVSADRRIGAREQPTSIK